MLKNKVRWAIIGTGNIAQQFIKDFQYVSNVSLEAVSSRDPERAKLFAEYYNIPRALSYEQLFIDKNIDAVYIATTNNTHFKFASQCIENHKAVLCEKPITMGFSECQILADLAKKNNVFLMEAMWMYFLPVYKKVEQWLAENRIGQIKLIEANFGYQMNYDPENRLFNEELGGGALLDLGIYPIALATLIFKTFPDQIKATGIKGNTNVDELTGILLKYGDKLAVLNTTILATTRNNALIYGENGYIEIPDFYKANRAILYDRYAKQTDIYVDKRTTIGYNFEIQEATNCILKNKNESRIMPHSRSLTFQKIMDEVQLAL